jgi:aminopeptidase N
MPAWSNVADGSPTGYRRAARAVCALVVLGVTGCGLRGTEHVEGPRPEAHVVRYETDAIIDPVTGTVRARSALTFQPGSEDPGTIGFLLNDGLDVLSVGGARVRSHRVRRSDLAPAWNLIEVDVDATVGVGPVTVEVQYAGVLNMDGAVGGITPAAIELSIETMWHPLLATLDREMIGRLRLRVPSGWTVVSSGPARTVDGTHELEMNVPQLDVPLFAAPGPREWSEGAFSIYSLAAADEEAAAVLEAATACGEFLDARFGSRDPLPPVRMVIVDRVEVAVARKNFIVLPRVGRTERVGLHGLLCHELAHYWTGLAGPFTADHWMSESVAEYTSALFVREHSGDDAFQRLVAEYARAGRGRGPVWTPEAQERPSYFAMYQLGPYLLSRLEERIGRLEFAEFLRRYMVHDVRTTAELLQHLAEVAGADAELWFRAELAGHHSQAAEDPTSQSSSFWHQPEPQLLSPA